MEQEQERQQERLQRGSRSVTPRSGILGDLMRMVARSRRPDLVKLADALLSERGEASGTALAAQIVAAYSAAAPAERLVFLQTLTQRFGADKARLDRAIARYRDDPSPRNGVALHAAAESKRQELIRRLNLAPGATEQLVRMREDVLRDMKAHPELETLDADFLHLFSSWFNRGFLVLQRINWHTPALILEKIIRYEAVHEITSWDDLRRRIDPDDRRCFGFFHPTLAGEPLIFVEVALCDEIPDAIATVLSADRQIIDARKAKTAAFYSISNCQEGLRGVPLGNFLIKQVVEELKRELPALKTFVTLSPVPGFASWLRREREGKSTGFLTVQDREALQAMDQPDWFTDTAACRRLRPVLSAAVVEYFLRARNAAGRVADPVARFHLNNGARLERIAWLGDVSAKGLAQGAGFMVNYLYDVDQIEKNHEAFANNGEVVASRAVRKLLREPPAVKA